MPKRDAQRCLDDEADPSSAASGRRAVVRLYRRVALRHVDAYQIHFVTYLEWADEGYAALLRQLGTSFADMESNDLLTPAVNVSCDYMSPARLDDDLVVTSQVLGVGRTSFKVVHVVTRGEHVLARVVVTHVALDITSERPIRVPPWIAEQVDAAAHCVPAP